MITELLNKIEEHRTDWQTLATERNWEHFPEFLAVWFSPTGEVLDSLAISSPQNADQYFLVKNVRAYYKADPEHWGDPEIVQLSREELEQWAQ